MTTQEKSILKFYFVCATIVTFILCIVVLAVAEEVKINIDKIILLESSGNPHAYNKRSKATGLMQITRPCFEDFKRVHSAYPYKDWVFQDMYDPVKNVEVGTWYILYRIPQLLKHFGKPITLENVLVSWNAGFKYVIEKRRLPLETKIFIKRYKDKKYKGGR